MLQCAGSTLAQGLVILPVVVGAGIAIWVASWLVFYNLGTANIESTGSYSKALDHRVLAGALTSSRSCEISLIKQHSPTTKVTMPR